jgi:hypothetical protein
VQQAKEQASRYSWENLQDQLLTGEDRWAAL